MPLEAQTGARAHCAQTHENRMNAPAPKRRKDEARKSTLRARPSTAPPLSRAGSAPPAIVTARGQAAALTSSGGGFGNGLLLSICYVEPSAHPAILLFTPALADTRQGPTAHKTHALPRAGGGFGNGLLLSTELGNQPCPSRNPPFRPRPCHHKAGRGAHTKSHATPPSPQRANTLHSLTAIPRRIHRISSDLRS